MVNLIGGVYDVLFDDVLYTVTLTREGGEEYVQIINKTTGVSPEGLLWDKIEDYFNQAYED
mgnify:CR=1 FL=1